MQKDYVTPKVKVACLEERNILATSGEALIIDTQSDNLFSIGGDFS